MNYNLSVCLTDLQGAQVQANQNGKKFLFVPIEDADLFLTEKGKVYLNLSMWEKKSGTDQYGKTHSIKQALSQARREAMGAEAARSAPFIGSAKEIRSKNENTQSRPVYAQQTPKGYEPLSDANDMVF